MPEPFGQDRDLAARLAAWGARRDAVPDAARQEARLTFLDTIACIVAGLGEPQTRAVRNAAGRISNGGVASSAGGRALVLGTAAHALDLDDYEIPGSTHPSAPILGCLLALAELAPVTWGEVLDAYVVGYEALIRLGELLGYGHYSAGWHATSTIGPFGAAAAAARLLGLGPDAFASALSLSLSMAAGLKAQFGSDAKAVHAGLAARAGVEAALLAEAGIAASGSVLEGPHGFIALHAGLPPGGTGEVARRIGDPFAILQHSPLRKPWPCCAYTHRAIEAALQISSEVPGPVRPIGGVLVRIPEPFQRVAHFRGPRSPSEARFSVTYCVAIALLDGEVGPASFRPVCVTRPDIVALERRIEVDAYDPGPGMTDMSPQHPDSVRVTLEDGRILERSIANVAGGAQSPMSREAIEAKLATCGGSPGLASEIMGQQPEAPFRITLLRLEERSPM